MAAVHALGRPNSPPPQTGWAPPPGGWAGAPVAATPIVSQIFYPPNMPGAASLAQGTGSDLAVTWSVPSADSTHGTATGFNLQYSPSGAGNWTIITSVTSPHDLSGLAGGAAIDVELQSVNAAGVSAWTAASTRSTASLVPNAPNAPAIASVTPPADGTVTHLTVTWTSPATDGSHGAATGYNIQSSPAGAGTWTVVGNVTSPFTIPNLTGATAVDVQVQATNAAASPSAWSATMTGTTWGATVAPGNWVAASSQAHGVSVAPSGGVNMIAVAAPTAVTAAAFGWSSSASIMPASGLIAAGADGQSNGWGQWFNAPASAGTYYLWLLAQGAGGTIGALVTSAITVT